MSCLNPEFWSFSSGLTKNYDFITLLIDIRGWGRGGFVKSCQKGSSILSNIYNFSFRFIKYFIYKHDNEYFSHRK